ncbi:MAG TPA: hypothetical protein VGK20_14360 [Candidatus Binatia bacterium]|jgi:hypothetical protein
MRVERLFLTSIVATAVVGVLAAAPAAYATSTLMKSCSDDVKKFGCTAKNDTAVHQCLEKNEKKGETDEGFSSACYKAHESYEKRMAGHHHTATHKAPTKPAATPQ